VAAALLCCFALAGHAAENRSAWQALSPSQKEILAPLEHDWSLLEPRRQQKWLEVAARFPAMPADERARVRERMVEWARLTPAQRTQARMQFQEVRQLPAEERQAKWQAYQALSDEERRRLALHPSTTGATGATGTTGTTGTKPLAPTEAAGKRKSTAPSAMASSGSNRAVAPIVVQARPGATTTTMTTRAATPRQVTAGAPKIAATAPYVDPATLLPKRPTATPARAASEPAGEQP
jgi:hypothetical protein